MENVNEVVSDVYPESSALAKWQAHPNRMYKITWDTSLDSKTHRMKFGLIGRNFEGQVIAAKAQTVCITYMITSNLVVAKAQATLSAT